MNTRKTKIMKRAEEMDMQEHDTKRPRTPDADTAPSSTIEELLEESCFIPRTPEKPPPAPSTPPRDIEEAARTLINLQNSPAWCDPIRPLDILGGQYPDPMSMDFAITKTKKVNKGMDVYFIGIRHGFQARPWNYNIQSPPASAQFVTRINVHTEKWKLPMKYSANMCTGLYAKVKNNALREQIQVNPNRLKCSLRLTCVYVGSEASGLTFELTHAYSVNICKP